MLPPATRDRPIWIRVGFALDGLRSTPMRDVHVVYDALSIRYVGEGGRPPPPHLVREGQNAPNLHLPHFTLLPGLIDAHTHLFLEGGELNAEKRAAYLQQSPEQLLALAKPRLGKLVRLGITALREAGDKDGVGLAVARLYDLSLQRPVMPYVDSPGAGIHHQGRYGSFMGEPIEKYGSLRASVEARVKAGAYRIKLIPTGIINFKKGAVTTEPQMTTEEVTELVAAAKSFQRQTFAHASGDTGIDRAIDGGVDTVEHGFFLREDQLAKMRDRNIAWVPTFAPVQEQVDHAEIMGWDAAVVANLQRILDQHAATLMKARALGVRIIAGSDAGSYGVAHGFGLLNELERMERAGMPAIEVINAATGISAERLGFREKFGRIAPGYATRFILTMHSPIETVANLRKPKVVAFDSYVLDDGHAVKEEGM